MTISSVGPLRITPAVVDLNRDPGTRSQAPDRFEARPQASVVLANGHGAQAALDPPGQNPVVRSQLNLPEDPEAARAMAREYLSGPEGQRFIESGRSFVYTPGEPAPRDDIIKAVQTFLFNDPREWDGALGRGTDGALGREQGGRTVLDGATVAAALAGELRAGLEWSRADVEAFRADSSDVLPDEARLAPGDRVLVIGDSHVGGLRMNGLAGRLRELGVQVDYVDQPGARALHFADPDAESYSQVHENYRDTVNAAAYDHVWVTLGTNDEIRFGNYERGLEHLSDYAEQASDLIEMARRSPGSPNVLWIASPRLPERGEMQVDTLGTYTRQTFRDTVRAIDGAYYFATHAMPLPLRESGVDVHPTRDGYEAWGDAIVEWATRD
ncbi:MAG: SGNH/GDSL hydrolase family protein [Myxococcota bacterium]